MKICVAGLRGMPDVMGGVERHCQELFPRLKMLGERDEYVILARKPYVPHRSYEYRRVSVVPLPCWRNKYFEAVSSTFLALLYARFVTRADLLHIHAIGPALFAPMARLLGMRLVVTHHGNDYDRGKWNGFAKWSLKLGECCAVMSANKVITVSKTVEAELKRRFPRQAKNIIYIPNGVSSFPDSASASWKFSSRFGIEKGQYILAVGRLVPEKGFHELIAAFERMKRTGLKLVIAGKADHEDGYAKALTKKACDDIIFTGFQDAAALMQLYSHASLFVLPSHHEGLPIAALEAASLGIPVLLSDIAPNKELGLAPQNYFPTGNIEALGEKLLSDHEVFRVNSEGISRHFDWEIIARATADVYRDAA